jgi:hypothetical protein
MAAVEQSMHDRRLHLIDVLRRMRLGQDVTLELADDSSLRGMLRECDGANVRLTDGRTVHVRQLREVVAHRCPWPAGIPAGEADGRHW